MPHPNVTLLLVDDDAMNRDALARRLSRSGYHVHRRHRRRGARMIREHRIDAVVPTKNVVSDALIEVALSVE